MKVKIINKSNNPLPKYQTPCAAGMDLKADLDKPISIGTLERKLIPTGIYIQLPEGFEAQLRPRSGLALKNGITVLNSPGTIDADYRGEIGVILINLSPDEFVVNPGDRIAQIVFKKYECAEWESVDNLENSERGSQGFGSTSV